MRTIAGFVIVYPAPVGVLLALIFGAIRHTLRPDDRTRTEWFIIATAFVVPTHMLAQGVTNWMSTIRPLKYDLYIYALDGLSGQQPSFLIGRFLLNHRWLQVTTAIAYGSLALAMLWLFSAYLWNRPRRELLQMVAAFSLNLFAALPIYFLVPVCGPVYAFPEFPYESASSQLATLPLSAPPNGIPSVHFSTAILILVFAKRWRAGRVLGSVYLVLMALATMGSGEHYLLDLILAVPYSTLVYKVCVRASRKDAEVASEAAVSAVGKL